jgi:hypothetical protein
LAHYNMIIQHRSGKITYQRRRSVRIPDQLETRKDYKPGVELFDLPCGGCKI